MKIVRNIPGAVKLYSTLHLLTRQKKAIEEAKAAGDDEREREAILDATKIWGKATLDALGCQLEVTGKENLPSEGPVVFMCNHQGYADIFALCGAIDTVQFGFLAKSTLARIPVYGEWIKRIRSVMIERDEPREAAKAIIESIKYIKRGFSLVIFPEGTRSKGGPVGEFRQGVFKVPIKTKVPVIPIALDGTAGVYEETGILKGSRIKVKIYPAVELDGEEPMREKELCEMMKDTISAGVKELQG